MFEFVSPEPKNEVKTKTKIYEKSPYDYRMNLKEGELVYFLTETIESAKIKAVTGKIHGYRNSIQTVGQTLLGKSTVKFKSINEVQEMLFQQKGVNWNDYSSREKRGGLCVKTESGWKMVEMPHVVCQPENDFYKLVSKQ